MFNKISMAGTGNYLRVATIIYMIGQANGWLPSGEMDPSLLNAILLGVYLSSEFMSHVGTWLRNDLNWGLTRKQPLE